MRQWMRLLRMELTVTRPPYLWLAGGTVAFVAVLALLDRVGVTWMPIAGLWTLAYAGPGSTFGYGIAYWVRDAQCGTDVWWLALPVSGVGKVAAKLVAATSLGLCTSVVGGAAVLAWFAALPSHVPSLTPAAVACALLTVPVMSLAGLLVVWWPLRARERFGRRAGIAVMIVGYVIAYGALGSLGWVYSRPTPFGPLVVTAASGIELPVWPLVAAWVIAIAMVLRLGVWLDRESVAGAAPWHRARS